VRLGDVCDKITDGTHHSPANHPTGDYKYITAKNIKPWGLDLSDITYIDAATHREIYSRCDVRKNDVLYIKDGATTGRVALNTLDEQFSLLSSVGVLRPGSSVRPKFLVYALQAPHVRDPMLDRMAGVAITRLTLKKLKDAVIPLAPIDQQDAIVAEIEKQFSRLDKAVAGLKRVKGNLKRYKAAILKAAFEGRLVPTEADLARREGRDYETGAQLLQRILASRDSHSQGKGKHKEPAAPDTTELPELPEGWAWASAEQLSAFITKGTTPSAEKLSGDNGQVQFLKVYNLTFDGVLNYRYKPAFISHDTHDSELARSKVRPGDVLINIVGPPLGQVSVVPDSIREANINQAIARFRPIAPLDSAFLALLLRCDDVMRWAIRRAKTTSGQSNLTLELCRLLPLPLPPLTEQHRIVAEVDRLLSIAREAEVEVETNLKRAQALRQSCLSSAFEPTLKESAR
jgi:type I restriction enzyme S subunit